jgi:hypothetical protein
VSASNRSILPALPGLLLWCWATDVLVGWISGGIFGYVLPSLVDYRGEPDSAAGRTLALLRHLGPMPRPATWGLRASFRF